MNKRFQRNIVKRIKELSRLDKPYLNPVTMQARPMMNKYLLPLVCFVLLASLQGCATIEYSRPSSALVQTSGDVQKVDLECNLYYTNVFGWKTRVEPNCTPVAENGHFLIADLEYGKEGDRISDDQFNAINQWIFQQRRPVTVLTYVHGWGHNASKRSGNRQQFGHLVARYQESIRRVHIAKGMDLSNSPLVLGVYIGWPGKTYSGFVEALSFGVAVRTADKVTKRGILKKDLLEISSLIRLNGNENTDSLNGKMLIIGHSLGGRIVSRSFIGNLDRSAGQSIPDNIFIATIQAAISADYFRPSMLKSIRHSNPPVRPQWININSVDDWALRVPFRLALAIGLVPKADSSDSASRVALGYFDEFRTHELYVKHIPDCRKERAKGCEMSMAIDGHPFPWTSSFASAGEKGQKFLLHFPEYSRQERNFLTSSSDVYEMSLASTGTSGEAGRLWNIRTDKSVIYSTDDGRENADHNGLISTVIVRMFVDLMWNWPADMLH